MEEKEPKVPLVCEQLGVSDEHLPSHMEFRGSSGPVIEELPTESENEERAIVLFKDVNTPLLRSPSNLSVTVNSDLFSGIKSEHPNFRLLVLFIFVHRLCSKICDYERHFCVVLCMN